MKTHTTGRRDHGDNTATTTRNKMFVICELEAALFFLPFHDCEKGTARAQSREMVEQGTKAGVKERLTNDEKTRRVSNPAMRHKDETVQPEVRSRLRHPLHPHATSVRAKVGEEQAKGQFRIGMQHDTPNAARGGRNIVSE